METTMTMMTNNRRGEMVAGLLAVLAAMSIGAFAASAAAGRVTAIRIGADPANYAGRCPVTINFRGELTVDGPGTVTFGVTRSDGGHGPGGKLTFKGAGSQNVSDSWQLGKSLSGWVMFGSGNVRSNRATFRVTCR
jgi:hypothetical protein